MYYEGERGSERNKDEYRHELDGLLGSQSETVFHLGLETGTDLDRCLGFDSHQDLPADHATQCMVVRSRFGSLFPSLGLPCLFEARL